MTRPDDLPPRPFMPQLPEWNNLVHDQMDASADLNQRDQADPQSELYRTLAALFGANALHAQVDRDDPEAVPGDFSYDFVPHESQQKVYQDFVAGQDEARRLPFDDFLELTGLVNHVLAMYTPAGYMPTKIRRMQYKLLIADSFKNPDVMRAFGGTPEIDNHDHVIGQLFLPQYAASRQQYFSSIDTDYFDDDDRADFERFTQLAAFNMAGWAQSQCSVNSLLVLEGVDRQTKEEYLLHFFFDVMGVRGNSENVTNALAYDKPTHDMLMQAFRALTCTATELADMLRLQAPTTDMSPGLREEAYMLLRLQHYKVSSDFYYNTGRSLAVPESIKAQGQPTVGIYLRAVEALRQTELYAQVRLANGARLVDHAQFATLREAYTELNDADTHHTTMTLGTQGSHYDFDYGPSLIRQCLGPDKESIKRGLIFLNRLFGTVQRAEGEIVQGPETPNDLAGSLYQPSVFVKFKPVVQAMKESGFSMEHSRPTFTRRGNVIIVRLADTA